MKLQVDVNVYRVSKFCTISEIMVQLVKYVKVKRFISLVSSWEERFYCSISFYPILKVYSSHFAPPFPIDNL